MTETEAPESSESIFAYSTAGLTLSFRSTAQRIFFSSMRSLQRNGLDNTGLSFTVPPVAPKSSRTDFLTLPLRNGGSPAFPSLPVEQAEDQDEKDRDKENPKAVAANVPPITPVPMAFWLPEPAPVLIASGNTPMRKAKDVMRMGRRRSRAASIAASARLAPCWNSSRANSTIRMAFFAASLWSPTGRSGNIRRWPSRAHWSPPQPQARRGALPE